MALQCQLGLLSEQRTRFASTYPANNGFNGTAFKSVGLAHSGHVEWGLLWRPYGSHQTMTIQFNRGISLG